jgi:hypothetical protein
VQNVLRAPPISRESAKKVQKWIDSSTALKALYQKSTKMSWLHWMKSRYARFRQTGSVL